MTVKADNKKRVVLPGAKPGDCFLLEQSGGEFRLILLKPAPKRDTVRLIKRHGYTVAAGTRPITQVQVRTALDDFP